MILKNLARLQNIDLFSVHLTKIFQITSKIGTQWIRVDGYVINSETGKLISVKPFAETSWASHIDMETGRPVENPDARYEDRPAKITPMA